MSVLKKQVRTSVSLTLISLEVLAALFAMAIMIYQGMNIQSVKAATMYYVSSSVSSSGNCLSEATACKTISAAISKVVAGDVITVLPGQYLVQTNISGKNGNSSSPITIIGKSEPSSATSNAVTYGFKITNSSYITIKNLEITKPRDKALDSAQNGSGVYVESSTGIKIDGNYIHDTLQPGVNFYKAVNSTISNNTIVKAGGYAGVVVGAGSGDMILGNDISKTIQNPLYPTLSSNSGADADGIKISGSNQTIRGNNIHDIYLSDTGNVDPHIDAISVGDDGNGAISNLVIDGNKLNLACASGNDDPQVMMTYPKGGDINGLIFTNNIASACRGLNINKQGLAYAIKNVSVYNNTFHDINDYGLDIEGVNGINVQNNIFYYVGKQSTDNTALLYDAATTGLVVLNNDHYWASSSISAKPTKSTVPSDTYNSVWDSKGFIKVDPKFITPSGGTNSTSGNYHLLPDSGLIDTGLTLSIVTTDLDGNSRPQGSAYDVGAYEYVSSGTSCTPATCSSLGKSCGPVSDNCGGTLNCGTDTTTCTTSFGTCNISGISTCVNGQYGSCSAVDPRVATCFGKTCGSDGCGGTCGTCSSGTCNASGLCQINGACGSSNGISATTAPSTNLCGAGTASGVTTGTTKFTWTCAGVNGGTTASCSATKTCTNSTCCRAKNSTYPYYKSSSKKCCKSSLSTSCINP